MGVFTTVFGGNNIATAQPTYAPLSISANTVLGWPTELTAAGLPVLAEILDVTATAGSLVLQLSDARQVSTGYCALFNNVGGNAFTVQDNLGNTLMTVASGQVWQLYLADNSTQAGIWRVFQFGAGVSSANAASLAGAGLKAISATLNENITINQQSVSYSVQNSDRAACVEWTGGSGGTFTLPNASTVGAGWFCFVQNSGTGTLAVTPPSGTINGASSLTLQPYDSAICVTDGTNFVTIGLGRSVASSFNFVQISLAGASGNVTLSGAQLNRVSYRFTGALAGNTVVIVPGSIQQYWVDNETTGAFSLTFSEGGAGGTVVVAQGNRAILYCDGTNVVNAVTVPSVSAGGTNTQVQYNNSGSFGGSTMTYQSGTGQFALAAASSGYTFTSNGNSSAAAIRGINTTSTGNSFTASPGSITGVAYAFDTNGTVGIYQSAVNNFDIGILGAHALNISATSNWTIGAPGSGVPLTVNGTSGTAIVSALAAAAGTANTLNSGASIAVSNGSTSGSVFQSSGNQTEIWQYNGSWNQVAFWNTNRGLTLNAPASGTALTVLPTAGTIGAVVGAVTDTQNQLQVNCKAAGSSILQLNANTVEAVLFINNQSGGTLNGVPTGTVGIGTVNNQKFTFGTSGGIQAIGPVAAALVDMTPDKGSWTANVTGPFTSTVVMKWERQGTQVTVWTDAGVLQTSTSAAQIALSGLPASITPSSTRGVMCQELSDASVGPFLGFVLVNSSNTINVLLCGSAASGPVGPRIAAGNFTGSGTAGLNSGWSITYSL